MAFPRVAAVVSLILLIGSFLLLCIGVLALITPPHLPGSKVEQANGNVVAVESNMDFHCGGPCHRSLRHLQRHLYEHAATYVYYTEETDKSLLALDVD